MDTIFVGENESEKRGQCVTTQKTITVERT